jgi:hypothetical protein
MRLFALKSKFSDQLIETFILVVSENTFFLSKYLSYVDCRVSIDPTF